MSVLTWTVKKTEKRKKKYFIRSDVAPQPQSRTAVHYLVVEISNNWEIKSNKPKIAYSCNAFTQD